MTSTSVDEMQKSNDVYHDYLGIVVGMAYDATKVKWRLDSSSSSTEYTSWESHMLSGFARCHTFDSKFNGHTEYILARRRVDAKVTRWWKDARTVYGVIGKTFLGRISSNFCVLGFCTSTHGLFQKF